MHTLIELEKLTTEWADARGIIKNGKPTTQALKLVEELGELAAAILRNKLPEALDGIGDCCVVLNNVAQQLGSSVTECWNLAYEEIKDRKGYLTPEGNFIKESDALAISYYMHHTEGLLTFIFIEFPENVKAEIIIDGDLYIGPTPNGKTLKAYILEVEKYGLPIKEWKYV